jgi:mono/diheme cytochrome c family protein
MPQEDKLLKLVKRFGRVYQEPGNGYRALVRSCRAFVCLLPVSLVAAIPALPMPAAAQAPAAAQQPAAPPAGLAVWRVGGCSQCHGGFAEGGGGNENPAGPNLRQTALDRAGVRETIACGRFEMPYHLMGAYTEVACYGFPVGEPPPEGFTAGRQLTAEQVDSLVDFLFEYVVAVPLTRQVCSVYFGGNPDAPACASFPP